MYENMAAACVGHLSSTIDLGATNASLVGLRTKRQIYARVARRVQFLCQILCFGNGHVNSR